MLTGAYRELLPAIAGCAATLTGLLFVAMTVAGRASQADRPAVIRQVRAGVSILAFTNALTISLVALVPGDNVGYWAVTLAVIGIFFTAAGARSIFSSHMARRHVPRQLALITHLLVTFVFELAAGLELIRKPSSSGAAEVLGNLLVALLIIGIARAWELVGDRHTGILSSIAVLAGHDPSHDGPLTPFTGAPDPGSPRNSEPSIAGGGRDSVLSDMPPARGASGDNAGLGRPERP